MTQGSTLCNTIYLPTIYLPTISYDIIYLPTIYLPTISYNIYLPVGLWYKAPRYETWGTGASLLHCYQKFFKTWQLLFLQLGLARITCIHTLYTYTMHIRCFLAVMSSNVQSYTAYKYGFGKPIYGTTVNNIRACHAFLANPIYKTLLTCHALLLPVGKQGSTTHVGGEQSGGTAGRSCWSSSTWPACKHDHTHKQIKHTNTREYSYCSESLPATQSVNKAQIAAPDTFLSIRSPAFQANPATLLKPVVFH